MDPRYSRRRTVNNGDIQPKNVHNHNSLNHKSDSIDLFHLKYTTTKEKQRAEQNFIASRDNHSYSFFGIRSGAEQIESDFTLKGAIMPRCYSDDKRLSPLLSCGTRLSLLSSISTIDPRANIRHGNLRIPWQCDI